jgi:hypothetical protein
MSTAKKVPKVGRSIQFPKSEDDELLRLQGLFITHRLPRQKVTLTDVVREAVRLLASKYPRKNGI